MNLFRTIVTSQIFSTPSHLLSLPFALTRKFESVTPGRLSALTIGQRWICLFMSRSSEALRLQQQRINDLWVQTLQPLRRSVLRLFASIGTLATARTHAQISVGMGFALNAGTSTGPGMQMNASPPYKQVVSELEEVRTRVAEAQAGPRRFETEKRKGEPLDPLRYRRFTWSSNKSNNTSPSASYTEFAPPLPSPPEHLVKDPLITHAIDLAGDRIRVDTPFDIDKIERQLSDHPNQPFVQSVIRGLREGFWPLDEGDWKPNDPVDIENYATSEKDLEVIRNSRDKEVALGRWSEGFNSLEEGMVVSPLFVVWQHGKGRLVIDQSASGLNDGIPREEAKVSYDDMRPFGQCLHDARNDHPHRKLVLFKSDVASAFLNLPAHPIWQLRQVVKVDNKYHIVRRLVIGSRASPRIWCAVSSLLCWLAIEKLGIIGLHVYMDDFFGWDFAGNLVYEDRKQEHGSPLKIIGFWVDIVEGSISLHQSSIDDIVSKINAFLATPKRRPSLKDFQHLGGHLNWLLNVLPWGKPATFELYKKTSGKTISHAGITINKSITEELTWLHDIIPRAVGIRFVDSLRWEDDEADLVMWTDATLRDGIAFVFAGHGFTYNIVEPRNLPLSSNTSNTSSSVDIFFLEQIGILSALYHASGMHHPPRRLLIWSDSLDAVSVFSSLSPSNAMHNAPLRAAAEIIISTGIDLRVQHIAGTDNIRADLLSRLMFNDYERKFPSDKLHTFRPPRHLLPLAWRSLF